MFSIQQANDHDCGFTALKILLANIHHDQNYLFIPTPFNEENVSFLDLMKEAEKYDVNLVALKASNKEELTDNGIFPFIARVKLEETYHALYVYKMNKKYVYYFDPATGYKKVKINEFTSMWTGELLSIKDYKVTKSSFKKPKLISNKELIISILIEFISAVSSVLSIFFIHKDSVIYLPIIFFTLALISEVLLKRYSLYVLKKVDIRMAEVICDVKRRDYYQYYLHYEEYKKYLMINNLSSMSAFLIFLIIAFAFLLNGTMNFIYIAINLVLAIGYIFFIKPKLDKDVLEINKKESAIKNEKDKLNAFTLMDEARNISYRYINKEYAYKYVVIALEIALAFIMMMYQHLVSVSYIFCYSLL
nr:hypothetical protein [Bacilli bacterium]